nr:immunoglobulin heavy chain junction region [Macaca mulatta]
CARETAFDWSSSTSWEDNRFDVW